MAVSIRVTVNVAKVLRALLSEPERPRFGYDLMKETKLSSGSLYPVLARLERAEWIIGEFEDIDESAEERPARRYYRYTDEGRTRGRGALAELHEQLRAEQDEPFGLSLRPRQGPA